MNRTSPKTIKPELFRPSAWAQVQFRVSRCHYRDHNKGLLPRVPYELRARREPSQRKKRKHVLKLATTGRSPKTRSTPSGPLPRSGPVPAKKAAVHPKPVFGPSLSSGFGTHARAWLLFSLAVGPESTARIFFCSATAFSAEKAKCLTAMKRR